MMRRWLRLRFGAPKSGDPEALHSFVDRQSAFVAQKTVIDYCRVKAGRHERETFADPDFQAALTHCRWQTFPAAVSDVLALAEAWLRPQAKQAEPRLAAALARIGAEILSSAAAPTAERETLDSMRHRLPRLLAERQEAAPTSAHRLPLESEAPLLATLPIHPEQRIGETPAIRGALRFHIVSTQQEMERYFDRVALAHNLTVPSLR